MDDIQGAIRYLKGKKETNTTPSIDIKLTTAITILESDIWIPITDHKPTETGYYRVTMLRKDNKERVVDVIPYDKGFITIFGHLEVLAWKPLDEPYRG